MWRKEWELHRTYVGLFWIESAEQSDVNFGEIFKTCHDDLDSVTGYSLANMIAYGRL